MIWKATLLSCVFACAVTGIQRSDREGGIDARDNKTPDHLSLENGGVSGDFLEHRNLYPLTKPVILRDTPVQCVHISLRLYGNIQITWFNPATFSPNSSMFEPKCWYGESASVLPHVALGMAYSYPSGMFTHTLNTAVLDLNILTNMYNMIYYKCGDDNFGWSDVYTFQLEKSTVVNSAAYGQSDTMSILKSRRNMIVTMTETNTKMLALIGDLGVTHGLDTMSALQEFVHSGDVKMVVHAGDISYADNFSKDKHNNSYIWVEYMNEISVFTPWIPYMTAPGNHEAQYNFEPYRNWLPMPNEQSESLSPYWFSFDYMGVHFLSFSTEHNFNQTSDQYKFMKQDLIKANTNRQNVPWIIIFGHRPLYCSCLVAESRCTEEAPLYRSFLEDLLYQQQVDVYWCGHNHNYERTYPVYRNRTVQKNYMNQAAPMYIVNGEAGNPEANSPTFAHNVDWRANFFNSTDNGFLLMAPTQTSLDFRFIRSKDRVVMDTFTLTKT